MTTNFAKPRVFAALWVLTGILLLAGCSLEPEPVKPWKDMTTSERVESLESQLKTAKFFGEKQMRGDLKRGIEKMLNQAEAHPSPEFEPVLTQAAETLVEYEYHDTASRSYEVVGDYQKAAEQAEKAGDLDRVQELMTKMEQQGVSISEDKAIDIRVRRGLDFLAQAEATYKNESTSSHVALQGKGPTETRKILAQAVEQLQGAPLPVEDFERLLTLQIAAADGKSEATKAATEAQWVPPSEMNPDDAWITLANYWSDKARDESQPELAEIYLSKALAELQSGKGRELSPDKQRQMLETTVKLSYSSGNFSKALEYAQQLFPNDESKLYLYKYAVASKSDSIRKEPFAFPPAVKGKEEQTYIYMFSPVSGQYVHGGFEERVAPPAKITWSVPEEGDGVKATFKGREDFLYLISVTGGFRTGFKPGRYDAKQVGVSSAHPGIGFAGVGNFKYGQFVVHEIEWESGDKKKLARCAVDFLGSGTGKLSDVCYGKIRYRSHYK